MNGINQDTERRKIELEIIKWEEQQRISRLAMARHLAMLNAERKCKNNSLFEILSTGALIWAFVLLICITIMMFVPLIK